MLEKKEVFADVVNVLLAAGEILFEENEFRDLQMKFKKEDSSEQVVIRRVIKESDYAFFQMLICDESEDEIIKKYIPIYAYECVGQIYLNQLEFKNQSKKLPVLSLVLYLGVEHWNSPESIKSSLDIPEEMEPFVNDYKIHVFEIAQLGYDQLRKFKSEFRVVAEELVHRRIAMEKRGKSKSKSKREV